MLDVPGQGVHGVERAPAALRAERVDDRVLVDDRAALRPRPPLGVPRAVEVALLPGRLGELLREPVHRDRSSNRRPGVRGERLRRSEARAVQRGREEPVRRVARRELEVPPNPVAAALQRAAGDARGHLSVADGHRESLAPQLPLWVRAVDPERRGWVGGVESSEPHTAHWLPARRRFAT